MIRFFIILFTFFLFFLGEERNIWAKSISDRVMVQKLKWDGQKKMYRLTLFERAGVYYGEDKDIDCLVKSLEERKEISVTYDLKELIFKSCMIKKN